MMAQRTWFNEPPFWHESESGLLVRTGRDTDFWNRTFYGFTHDNGHHYAEPVNVNFSAEISFSADYVNLYDQAGLMLRINANNWLKTGVEYTDGALHFSVVVTRDNQSDWSVLALPETAKDGVTLRLTRHEEALRVQLRDGDKWRLVRLAYLDMPETVAVGPMCCSPQGEGLEVTFSHWAVGDAIARDLHG